MDQGRSRQYVVQVGEQTVTVSLFETHMEVNGKRLDCALEQITEQSYVLRVGDRRIPIVLERSREGYLHVTVENQRHAVRVLSPAEQLRQLFSTHEDAGRQGAEIRAPMPGLVLDVLVSAGDHVEAGQSLLVLEAMKMENEICAELSGTVAAVHAKTGSPVGKGDLLIEIGAEPQ